MGPHPFQLGLHDLKYVDQEGRLALPPEGKQVSTLEEYGRISTSWCSVCGKLGQS